jgi:hypothetical protein
MKKLIAILLVLAFALPAAAVVDDGEVAYLGGTAAGMKENTIGHFDTTQATSLVFDYKGGKLEIPWASITHYEYTRKLARHLGITLTIAVALVKHLQRRHYFVIDYKDEKGVAQSAVFEVAKDLPQTLEAVFRVRAVNARQNAGAQIYHNYQSCQKAPCPYIPPCAVNRTCPWPESPRPAAPNGPPNGAAASPNAPAIANQPYYAVKRTPYDPQGTLQHVVVAGGNN